MSPTFIVLRACLALIDLVTGKREVGKPCLGDGLPVQRKVVMTPGASASQ